MESTFKTNDPLEFLKHEVEERLATGSSFRKLSINCGFKSSNYLQLLLSGKRKMGVETAKKIAFGLELNPEKSEFLELLVKQSRLTGKPLEKVKARLSNLRASSAHEYISDNSLYDAWYHSVIYEMAGLPDFDGKPASIVSKLNHQITLGEAESSLKFLQAKGWIKQHEDDKTKFTRRPIHFSGGNKKRNIKIQAMHRRFLEMAIHRLHDDLSERTYQAITMTIPRDKFPLVKTMMQDFIDDLERKLTTSEPGDQVIRVQCCGFKVTK